MSDVKGTVHVVDDDPEVAASLRSFFEAHWLQARTYHSAEEFLAEPDPAPGCLLVDLRMPGLSGIGLIERLAREHRLPPTIVLTAHGDVPVADVGVRLNDVLLSALAVGSDKYGRPREAFAALVAGGGS